jgi:hypothetical protein
MNSIDTTRIKKEFYKMLDEEKMHKRSKPRLRTAILVAAVVCLGSMSALAAGTGALDNWFNRAFVVESPVQTEVNAVFEEYRRSGRLDFDFNEIAVGDIFQTEFTTSQGTIDIILMKSENVRTIAYGPQGELSTTTQSFLSNVGIEGRPLSVFRGTTDDYAASGNFVAHVASLRDDAVIWLGDDGSISHISYDSDDTSLLVIHSAGLMRIPSNENMHSEDFEINGMQFTYIESGERRYLALIIDENFAERRIILEDPNSRLSREQLIAFAEDIVIHNMDSNTAYPVGIQLSDSSYNNLSFDEAKGYIEWDTGVFDRFNWIPKESFQELTLWREWGQITSAVFHFDVGGTPARLIFNQTASFDRDLRSIEGGPTELDTLIYHSNGYDEIVRDSSGRLFGIRHGLITIDAYDTQIGATIVTTVAEDVNGYIVKHFSIPDSAIGTREIIRDITR